LPKTDFFGAFKFYSLTQVILLFAFLFFVGLSSTPTLSVLTIS